MDKTESKRSSLGIFLTSLNAVQKFKNLRHSVYGSTSFSPTTIMSPTITSPIKQPLSPARRSNGLRKKEPTQTRGKEYYANLAIGPGIKFYQALCSLSHPIHEYGLRIPDTYHVEMEILLCFDENKGYITKTEQISVAEYQRALISEARRYFHHFGNDEKMLDLPAYIIRKRTSLSNYTILGEVITWKRLESRMKGGAMLELILQRYVKPYRNRRTIFRYTYYCDQTKSRKASYLEIIGPLKEEVSVTNWDYRDDNLVPLYKSYNGLKEFELTAKRINHLINVEYGYRLQELKLDFIKHQEQDPKFWLIDLHSFELDKDFQVLSRVMRLPGASAEYTAPVKCTLCKLPFKNDEVDKCLPMKMLVDLKNHTQKRKLFHLFQSFKGVSEITLMHNCRVCNLCYHLIVQENLLIEVEKKMAAAQGIPVKEVGTMEEYKTASSNYNSIQRYVMAKDTLIQWRVMIYPLTVTGLNIEPNHTSLEMRISGFYKDETIFPITAAGAKPPWTAFEGQRKLLDLQETTANNSLSSLTKTETALGTIEVNRLRVLYFFSTSTKISEFLKKFIVTFTLVGKHNKEILAEVKCPLLNDYIIYNENVLKADKHRRVLQLFTPSLQMLKLDLYTGLCIDGEVDVSTTQLYKYPIGEVYYPDNGYYNSFPLPEEWMEVFRKDDAIMITETLNEESLLDKSLSYEASLSVSKIVSTFSTKNKVRPHSSITRTLPSNLQSPLSFGSDVKVPTLWEERGENEVLEQCKWIQKPHRVHCRNVLEIPTKSKNKLKVIKKNAMEDANQPKKKKKKKNRRANSAIPFEQRINSHKPLTNIKKVPKYLTKVKSPYGNVMQLAKQLVAIRVSKKQKRTSSMPPTNTDIGLTTSNTKTQGKI